MTRKLYEEDVYMTSCTAKVVGNEGLNYYFDQTIFFPEGGGQNADIGYINGIEVLDVQEKGHEIRHTLKSPLTSDQVEMQIDWDKRFDEMQQHCGEHILSGVIMDHYGGKNKGFHIGKDFVTIDIDCEITNDMLDEIEDKANDAIYQNIPLTFELMKDDGMYDLRKEPTVTEDVRIVTIPGVDCVACCGTHPRQTGEVGLIKLFKVEKNKGLYRIYFKCGKRAMRDLNRKTKLVQYFNQQYSSDDLSLIERYEQEKVKQETLRKEFIALNREKINGVIESQLTTAALQVLVFDNLSSQDMNYVIKQVSEKMNVVILIHSKSENKVMLSHDGSHKIHCGQLFKVIKEYDGRGGGNAKTAQGVFTDTEKGTRFVDYLKNEIEGSL